MLDCKLNNNQMKEIMFMQNKCCAECMYYNEMYCMRKKDIVEADSFCLHYVPSIERHSMNKIIGEIAALIYNEQKGEK